MSLTSRGAAWHDEAETVAAGVSVTYSRGNDSVSLTAVVGRTLFSSVSPGTGNGRASVEWGDRDYLIRVADLVLNGSPITPQKGDQITHTVNGVSLVFELMTPTGEPAWRYSDELRTTYRIHTKRVG